MPTDSHSPPSPIPRVAFDIDGEDRLRRPRGAGRGLPWVSPPIGRGRDRGPGEGKGGRASELLNTGCGSQRTVWFMVSYWGPKGGVGSNPSSCLGGCLSDGTSVSIGRRSRRLDHPNFTQVRGGGRPQGGGRRGVCNGGGISISILVAIHWPPESGPILPAIILLVGEGVHPRSGKNVIGRIGVSRRCCCCCCCFNRSCHHVFPPRISFWQVVMVHGWLKFSAPEALRGPRPTKDVVDDNLTGDSLG